MNKFIFVLFTIILGVKFTYDGDVLVLNDGNVNAAIKQYDFILLEFYAQWCGHCKEFAPQYQALAQRVKEIKINLQVAKLDAGGNEKQAQNRYKVTSFPTIMMLIKGFPVPYLGDRSFNSLIDFIGVTMNERTKHISTIDDVYKFIGKNDVCVIYFAQEEHDPELKVFNNVARMFPNIAFAYTELAVARKFYDTEPKQVILLRNFDEKRKEYTGKLNEQELGEFVQFFGTQSVEDLDYRNYQTAIKSGPSLVLLWDQSSERAYQEIKLIAPYIKSRITVVSVNQYNRLFNQAVQDFALEIVNYPTLIYVSSGQTFQFQDSITQVNVMRFIYQANEGLLKKKTRSQLEPKRQGAMYQLVGTSFIPYIENSTEPVLVQFCDKFEDDRCLKYEYEDMALKLQGAKLTYIELSQNEVEGVSETQLPVFKLYRPGLASNPIALEGEASPDNILKFLKKWANIKIKGEDL
ncbi:hypothetical protein pb186bvf_006310 [Paramecium bursaria]